MTLEERIAALATLGQQLREDADELLLAHIKRTEFHNGWMTEENYRRSIRSIAEGWLTLEALSDWINQYELVDQPSATKTVGLVLAGNIPLVGWHDVISVFVAGHRAQLKLSEKDAFVLPYLLKKLAAIDERTAAYFEVVTQLKGFDAVIATGSNNSARYFEAYFGKYPHIIRRNRNAVAVLSGRESEAELLALGDDIFTYFGLGCRNVSKLYLPRAYEFQPLLEVLHEWRHLQNHTKYKNNFDYNHAKLTLNKGSFFSNGAVILREDESLLSHIAGLYYSFYEEVSELEAELNARTEEIQLVAAQDGLLSMPTKSFGEAQQPGLLDYADGVDTMSWLSQL
ncbi:MAG: acyl-CoA reductase [Bacteroidota bacterium]